MWVGTPGLHGKERQTLGVTLNSCVMRRYHIGEGDTWYPHRRHHYLSLIPYPEGNVVVFVLKNLQFVDFRSTAVVVMLLSSSMIVLVK